MLSVDRIGSGELPAQEVAVEYKTRRILPPQLDEDDPNNPLNPGGVPLDPSAGCPAEPTPEEVAEDETEVGGAGLTAAGVRGTINWQRSTTEGKPVTITVTRSGGETLTYTGVVAAEEETAYIKIAGTEVPKVKRQNQYTFAAEAAQNVAQAYYEYGIPFANARVKSSTITQYEYDKYGNEVGSVTKKYEPLLSLLGRANLPIAFSSDDYIIAENISVLTGEDRDRLYTSDGYQKRCSERWEHAAYHLQGQIGVYQGSRLAADASEVATILNRVLATGLVMVDYQVNAQYVGKSSRQERPKQVERVADYLSQEKGVGEIPEKTETGYAFGNAEADRTVSMKLPMAPDDTIEKDGDGWAAQPSEAAQRAKAFGETQNRMRLGHREGLSIQIAPDLMPAQPFSSIYVKAAGLTGLYRVNGSSWTFDANGIVCSIDAMFWGGAGQE
jgi:hypothetical protein